MVSNSRNKIHQTWWQLFSFVKGEISPLSAIFASRVRVRFSRSPTCARPAMLSRRNTIESAAGKTFIADAAPPAGTMIELALEVGEEVLLLLLTQCSAKAGHTSGRTILCVMPKRLRPSLVPKMTGRRKVRLIGEKRGRSAPCTLFAIHMR